MHPTMAWLCDGLGKEYNTNNLNIWAGWVGYWCESPHCTRVGPPGFGPYQGGHSKEPQHASCRSA